MAALKDIQRKISAVKQTQKITKAMNMVAAAKLRQWQGRMENFNPYASKFAEVMGSLASRIDPDIHPFLIQAETVSAVEVIGFSSDRGLCGSFNSNAVSLVEDFARARQAEGKDVSLTLVGRKLRDYFRHRDLNVRDAYGDTMTSFDYVDASAIAQKAMDLFLADEVQEVYLCYTTFEGMGRQVATTAKLLPIEAVAAEEEQSTASEYVCEPSVESIIIDLLPKSVTIQVYNAMLHSATSEQAARMAAMDNATKNCKEMIQDLTLVYNKARQAAVTAELLDIVCGAEALKG